MKWSRCRIPQHQADSHYHVKLKKMFFVVFCSHSCGVTTNQQFNQRYQVISDWLADADIDSLGRVGIQQENTISFCLRCWIGAFSLGAASVFLQFLSAAAAAAAVQQQDVHPFFCPSTSTPTALPW